MGEWEVRVRCVLRRVEWREEEDDEDGAEEASAEASASTSATPSASRLPLPRQVVDLTIDASLGGVAGHPRSRVVRGVALALMGPHQRRNAELAVAALEFLRLGGGLGARDGDLRAPPNPLVGLVVRRRGAETRAGVGAKPGVFRAHRRGKNENARDEEEWRLVADGAHTRARGGAVSNAGRGVPRADWPRLAIVVASASDKDHEGVLREVYRAAPDAVVLCRVAVAGGASDRRPPRLAAAAKRAEKKARNRRGGRGAARGGGDDDDDGGDGGGGDRRGEGGDRGGGGGGGGRARRGVAQRRPRGEGVGARGTSDATRRGGRRERTITYHLKSSRLLVCSDRPSARSQIHSALPTPLFSSDVCRPRERLRGAPQG